MQLLDRLLITLQSGIYSYSVDNVPSYILLIKGLLHFPKGEMPTRTNSDRKKDVISFFFFLSSQNQWQNAAVLSQVKILGFWFELNEDQVNCYEFLRKGQLLR